MDDEANLLREIRDSINRDRKFIRRCAIAATVVAVLALSALAYLVAVIRPLVTMLDRLS